MFFQNLKAIIFSQQELCLVTKPLSTLTTPIVEKGSSNDMLSQQEGSITSEFSDCVVS
jgi:hypothetical protein